MRTIWIIIVLVMACSANAGPWLRPDGEGFMSVDSIGSIGRDQGDLGIYSGIFVEYGLTERATLGLTGGVDQARNGHATAYFRKSIPNLSSTWLISYEIGLGADFGPDRLDPNLRFGLSTGRGGLFKDGTGWTHIDTWLTTKSNGSPIWKLEATLGKRGKKDWMYMLQLFADHSGGHGWQYELSPSIAIPLARERHLQLDLSAMTRDKGRYGIKIALWRTF